MTGSYTCCNLAPVGEDELTKSILIEGSNTSIFSLAICQSQTPTPTQAPIPTPGPPSIYNDVNLKKATRLALKLFIKG